MKFSALEIYNECVRDLLSADGAPLRLLDDPEVNSFPIELLPMDVFSINLSCSILIERDYC